MKYLVILGSTGSIGTRTLEVVRNFPKKFRILGLSTNANVDILYQQIREFSPEFVCVKDRQAFLDLKQRLAPKIKILFGEEGLKQVVGDQRIDQVVLAVSGSDALVPLLAAIENGKDIALANKEALVMAGPIIMQKVKAKKVRIIPIDSEQSAIWQCLDGQERNKLKNIYLTASGGPFRQKNKKELRSISVKQALRHPRWKMGKKISVDSATLMNKGLELFEAMYLFGVGYDKIKILIHPEAIIHSMVEFIDGVTLAQLSITDMRIPIQYALSYPVRLESELCGVDFYRLKNLHFQKPDFEKFPCLELAYRAAKKSGTAPCVLNAANEVSVEQFLENHLRFIYIPRVIEKVLKRHRKKNNPNLNDILEADFWGRQEAYKVIQQLG